MIRQIRQVKDVLERLYEKYNHHSLIKPDPLQFVYKYRRKADMEIAAFMASALAYGRVGQIEKSLTDLFGRMGNSLYDFVMSFGERDQIKLKDFKYRFTTGQAISDLLKLLKNILKRFNSIEIFFVQGYHSSDKNIIPALSRFCNSLLEIHSKSNNGQVSKGLSYLLARPETGSVCKRLNLFLRWMVRDDDVDTGLWKEVDKRGLIVPVDVHMSRLCRVLGLYNRKTVSLSAAVEITNSFAEIEPNDPVRYDFALSRIGIIENCNGNFRPECKSCELAELCQFVE